MHGKEGCTWFELGEVLRFIRMTGEARYPSDLYVSFSLKLLILIHGYVDVIVGV
jgi:hypothetical protein